MKRSLWIALALAYYPDFSQPAAAHAFLDHATPAVGSTVHAAPVEIKLWFTERIEPAFSRVGVMDQSGKRLDKGDSRVDDTNSKILRVSVPQLGPGTYRVTWRVLSVDTHVTEGDFTFDVVP
jgi:methionine-rich copper-binding protein CopC